ncbi:MAG: GreA/GreB family elongation factor [Candidatus Magasanikbacteria bacterium]
MRLPFRKPGKFSQIKNDPLMTAVKLNELEKKLEKLKKVRPGLAKEVARLAELGDFSENVEYQLAKGRLRGVNGGILKLERQIADAVIISTDKNNKTVQIGSVVIVETAGKEKTYQILGSSETNPEKGIISHSSPIGSALLGGRVGDIVEVKIGDKKVEYRILEIK